MDVQGGYTMRLSTTKLLREWWVDGKMGDTNYSDESAQPMR